MEGIQRRPSVPAIRRILMTRKGAMTVAAAMAAVAGILLLVYLDRYRDSVTGGVAPAPVLVADRLIPKGTMGDAVISGTLFRSATVTEEQLREGAITDAAAFDGKVTTRDIYPGQQLTAADFARDADPLRGQLAKNQRAIAVPLDAAHGLVGDIRTGDHIDVLAGFNSVDGSNGRGQPVLKVILRDILVLKAPPVVDVATETNSRDVSNILLRTSDRQAANLAYASDNGKVWFVLRPPTGAKDSEMPTVSLQSLVGVRPIEVYAKVKKTPDGGGTVTVGTREAKP
jgi:Flp pilus assembly protein CpaB